MGTLSRARSVLCPTVVLLMIHPRTPCGRPAGLGSKSSKKKMEPTPGVPAPIFTGAVPPPPQGGLSGVPPPPVVEKKSDRKRTDLEKMAFRELRDIALKAGLKLPLGSSKDAYIDALSGEKKANVVRERPWRWNKQLGRDPRTKKYYRLLKIARVPEAHVYERMVNAGCPRSAIGMLFGEGPPPQHAGSSLASMPTQTPDMVRSKTDEFQPGKHSAHPIDTKNLNATSWRSVAVAKKSESGSSGVIFCLLPKGVVVLKSGSSLAEEMYGSWLAREIGIHVPELRLASYNDGEYYEIQAALKRTASLSTKIGISRILQRKQIAVMEYVNGKPLVEVSGIPEKSALRQVGGIIALDVVLNNFDRLPLVWNNQGNADNIFLVPEENNMYALDNRIVCPTSIQVQHVHLSKVNMLCDNMKKSGHESKEWIKLQRFWVTRTPMAMLSKEDLKEIAKGFRDTAKMCVEKLTKKRLVSMFKDLGALDKGDNFWMSQVCGINVEFILAVINVFAKHFC